MSTHPSEIMLRTRGVLMILLEMNISLDINSFFFIHFFFDPFLRNHAKNTRCSDDLLEMNISLDIIHGWEDPLRKRASNLRYSEDSIGDESAS